jgi:ubiquinol-cytochrome c reductase cytochrome b subunit
MIRKKNNILSIGNTYLVDSPLPSNLTYNYNYGSLLGVSLVIQIITGVTLAMHYTASIDSAFSSVEHVMRDVNFGYVCRYVHANVASYFFVLIYLHISRGIYYGSYKRPRTQVWNIGVVIFLLTMAIGFLGYTLPWGSMSYWGATVITNLFSAIPWIGKDLVELLWGSFCVENPTLNRFFSLHYLLPFGLAGLVILHIISLHENGSSNPLGITSNLDRIPFHPYYTVKDIVGILVYLIVISITVYYLPNYLNHTDNYIKANPLVTPAHIAPEWYFLPFYAILRSIPDKLMGVIAMIGSILMLFLLNTLDKGKIRSSQFRPGMKMLFWLLISIMVILGYLGAKPVEEPYIVLGQIATVMYFGWFILVYIVSMTENKIIEYKHLSKSSEYKTSKIYRVIYKK